MTHFDRLQETGLRRLGKAKQGFHYAGANGAKVSRGDLARINALRIPPAWRNVAINRSSSAPLQAVGQDAAGRWQYLYHENHTARRDRQKFLRLLKFAEALPNMRKIVKRELRKPGLGRERIMACILRILSTSFIRPGSQVYASENGSYGIATLRPKHVHVKGDVVQFDFKGKGQVPQHRELKDRQVAKVLRELLRHSSSEVFNYQNGDGDFVDIKRRHINEYIKEVMGEGFSAKDFRTWAGTLLCSIALGMEGQAPSKTERKRKIKRAIQATSEQLGNTPAVCRSSYICPRLLDEYMEGKPFELLRKGRRGGKPVVRLGLSMEERSLLKFLRETIADRRMRPRAA